jgi:hypothetical protein
LESISRASRFFLPAGELVQNDNKMFVFANLLLVITRKFDKKMTGCSVPSERRDMLKPAGLSSTG